MEEKKSGTAALRREMEEMRLAYEEKIRALTEKLPSAAPEKTADEVFLEKQKGKQGQKGTGDVKKPIGRRTKELFRILFVRKKNEQKNK